ncbi:MAG: GmrSD restriction endonuclease domain-containing protein [Bacteroidota bacterium]
MATLFKEVSYNLTTIIQQIDMGFIGLPDIQRPFVWKDTKVRDLFDSMYKGYPVGYLLFWQNAHNDGVTYKNIGADQKQQYPSLLIVDGQQRLTSLYAVIKNKNIIRNNYNVDKIQIAFKPSEEKFEVADAALKRSHEYIPDISILWSEDFDIFDFINEFVGKIQQTRDLSSEEKKRIQAAISKLRNLDHYPFSSLELSSTITEEQVADVFVRINSQGKTLNQADFILTLMSVFWEQGRVDLEEFSRLCRTPDKTMATPFNYLMEPSPDQMLRVSVGFGFKRARLNYVYSILRGKDLDTGKFSIERRDKQFKVLQEAQAKALDVTNWHEYIKAVKQAGYVRGDYISSKNNFLYCYIMFLIGREQYQIPLFELKRLIARWFFMTSLTKRYTSSPETRMEADLAKLRGLKTADEYKNQLEEIIRIEFTNDFWETTLPAEMSTSSSTSPSLFAHYAALRIFDAKGLFSKLKVSDLLQEGIRSKKSALERHHLFPKNHLRQNEITEDVQINQIANYALVEWSDNIEIQDSAPSEYLPYYKNRIENGSMEEHYKYHGLWEGWENEKYMNFLAKRRIKLANIIKEAFYSI